MQRGQRCHGCAARLIRRELCLPYYWKSRGHCLPARSQLRFFKTFAHRPHPRTNTHFSLPAEVTQTLFATRTWYLYPGKFCLFRYLSLPSLIPSGTKAERPDHFSISIFVEGCKLLGCSRTLPRRIQRITSFILSFLRSGYCPGT